MVIYTDGACKGNPGPGGWGAILRFKDKSLEIFDGELQTTNNRMELTAVIMALSSLKRSCSVQLYTDSKYVLQGATNWIEGWKRNNWMTASKKPVKNVDLWKKLAPELARHKINWRWVEGHTGVPDNERADQLANAGILLAQDREHAKNARS